MGANGRVLDSVQDNPKLLLVSMDGFRWDYLSKNGNFVNMKHIIQNGVTAKRGLKNVFLTKTFPNHYTILTGLYAESHGLVGNTFYDPVLKEKFDPGQNSTQLRDSRWFDVGAEPIWATNQKAGTSRRSGSVFFWGSDAPVKGFIPYRHLPFDGNVPFRNRTDIIIGWFTDPNPINLGLLYFNEPDHTGHIYGPESKEVLKKIEEMDEEIGYLLKRLKEVKLLDTMNIIITSDHGMTSLINDTMHAVDLNKYINIDAYDIDSTSPVATIRPKSEELKAEILKNLSSIPHVHVYRKQDIPNDYHYQNNRRIDPITVEPDEHYWVMYNNTPGILGEHGYNNSLQSMHPFFIAMGPSFKSDYSVETFNSVDIYPLMCELLGITPAPNNGSLSVVKDLLKDQTVMQQGMPVLAYIAVLIVIGSVGAFFAFATCRARQQLKKKQTQGSQFATKAEIRYKDLNTDEIPLVGDTSEDELDAT